ncbi:hypothetical protein PENTCL1PPCAC_12038, partial [Pristionchus entomophagus]
VSRGGLIGRACHREHQCTAIDCAPEAECRESPAGPLCQCISGYVDVSRQHGRPQGRVCRAVVNECAEGRHDCSSHAACIDTAEGYACRCHDGYRDESTQPHSKPGRVCVREQLISQRAKNRGQKTFTPDPPECDVNDPLSCNANKKEVCVFTNGTYKCRCASGYSRLSDGRCLVINECADTRLNNCHKDAQCIDQAEGYSCSCNPGFADVSPKGESGRICRRRVNECNEKAKYGVDCSNNAICVDKDDGYECRCRPGFADVSASYAKLPGRQCLEAIDECADESLNDCSEHAVCEDTKESYVCACRAGFVDASPNSVHYPGRVCRKPIEKITSVQEDARTSLSVDECDPKNPKCGRNEVCSAKVVQGQNVCACADNAFRYHDGSCRLYSACSRNHNCDQNAVCLNMFDSFTCQCRPGFLDVSQDAERSPGRKCKELVNECATGENTCDRNARCIDATDGYACVCDSSFTDVSSTHGLPPGRRCVAAHNECLSKSLNTCDDNADCVVTNDGYTCQCYAGFIDVSSMANLAPGRVCTVQTTCPKQKTDLMFLIDGSGSIGSYVFKNEVLRFVREFVELFEIGSDKTRVGLIQYSDQIRHEFDLNEYPDKASVLRAITETQYLTGLTRTGAAIQHMVKEGFSERRGARARSNDVSRVAIVLTDGRSQDNVTEPAMSARQLGINTFAIGVTDHVLASELETIAGSSQHWFYVDRFKDLDTRLRSIIQKVACPQARREPTSPEKGPCNARSQTGCDRSLNEFCVEESGVGKCVCPEGFQRHPLTRVCGGALCNPQLLTSCIFPEECLITPFLNHRCSCPEEYTRDYRSGFCVSIKEIRISHQEDEPQGRDCSNGGTRCEAEEQCVRDRSGQGHLCECRAGFQRRSRDGRCAPPGTCDPSHPFACDVRKRERCLPHGNYYTCQCDHSERRHPVTGVCLRDECSLGMHDCDRSARCIDTDEGDGFICACPNGFFDRSPNPIAKPGRLCIAEQNECLDGSARCSPNALCTDTEQGYACRCKPGHVDHSPNPAAFPGLVCTALVNECASPRLNNCDRNAICIDTAEAYTCVCKAGFVDEDEFRNPGRRCKKVHQNDRCQPGKNDCDRNARCIQIGDNDYSCACPAEFRDKSPDVFNRPGRVCIPVIPECDNPTLNDCDSPDRAICTDTDDGYHCRCRSGFLDISPSIDRKPGRLCKQLTNECAIGTHDCARDGGICEDTPDSYTCRCALNYLDVSFDRVNRPGRKCKRLIDECATGQNDCSAEATCTDTEDSFICACPASHNDVSPDVASRPGRRCLLRINECATNRHDCSSNADCIDTPQAFQCRCRDDFVDESPDRQNRPGRVCRPALVDECRIGKHDCSRDAICHDLQQGFTCECRDDFIDQSPNRVTHPGRVCSPRPTPPPDECRLDAPGQTCKVHLNEVCRLVGGIPKCSCPVNYERDASGACTITNECANPSLNDCHVSAECVDQMVGYTCRCRQGFKDMGDRRKPGRMCKPLVNECQFPHLNDCHQHAVCTDLEEGYECKCHQGFKDLSQGRPGRLCKQLVNECTNPSLNSCDKNARCFDEEEGYRCECRSGFLDVSPTPTLKGRACRQLMNECANPSLNDCDKHAQCKDTPDSYECECPAMSRDISPSPAFPGRVCLMFENECETGRNDCDQHGICRDNEQSFSCDCPAGFADRSPNKLQRPGRVCVQLVDECSTGRHTCSKQADCRDLEEGYTCECKDGYVDRSPNMLSQPGRVCQPPEVCPQSNECSAAAICTPMGGNRYECTCIQGYVDQSPAGQKGRVCVRSNACRDARLNSCSRNSICYDDVNSPGGYRCECSRGFHDRSDDPKLAGRVCEPAQPPTPPPRHPCQDPQLNDCHSAASCRTTGPASYTCECLQGYADKSPDPRGQPGRICVLTQPVCLDMSQNDCHAAAICAESDGPDRFTCRCRDGYVDQSPDKHHRPGRICVEQVNECLSRTLNDCDQLAVCEDRVEGYTCRCPVNTIDKSPDLTRRPGRKCFAPVNECAHPSLNSCSRFADCFDKENGYECRCRSGYHDDNPSQPGTKCSFVINECESANLNDCDVHAECIDKPGGYDCRCRNPYRDEGPAGQPGRICRLNECKNPSLNNCDSNADCVDTDDSFYCQCKTGFYDNSPNPAEPGRVCLAFQQEHPAIQHIITETHHQSVQDDSFRPSVHGGKTIVETIKHDGMQCGRNYCNVKRHEVCISGAYCGCRPGQSRASENDVCVTVEKIPMQLRVVTRDRRPLLYSSQYGSEKSPTYVEFVDVFRKDIAKTFGGTSYAPRYVTTEMNYITHPKTVNSDWNDGLLVNFDVETTKTASTPDADECDVYQQMMASLQHTNNHIGGGALEIAMDSDILDPCHVMKNEDVLPIGPCGGLTCRDGLGEVCIGGSICGCPNGFKRKSPTEACYAVEGWNVPLLVVRDHQTPISYNRSYGNPQESLNKKITERFEEGVGGCYPQTEFRQSYITAEVNDIEEPSSVNTTLDRGILVNATMYFRKGAVRVPSDVYYSLVRYIKEKNHNEIGDSELYISDFQLDPFKPCFKNSCHSSARCIDISSTAYRCECTEGHRDLDPTNPGRKCLATKGYNECERPEDNECSENARCIDLEHLYKCECLPSFTDASPAGSIPGSMCVLDYCSDIDFCPRNTTCKNLEQQAECSCDPGMADIRKSERRSLLGIGDALCMNLRDVNECALGLTNCSGVAECTDKPLGYECKCPEGYIDGNPDEPGRVCGALLCDMCNAHGDCVHNAATKNVTCMCSDGWTGEFCQVAPSNASMILLILLALLFLLLALCCLLYFCTKCHCFPGAGRPGGLFYRDQSALGGYRKGGAAGAAGAWPWSTLEGSSSSESGAEFSGGSAAGEYYPDMGIPRAKLHSQNMARGGSSEHIEVSRMEEYLATGGDVRIPRAHLAGGARGGMAEFDAISEASSGYTIREEVERKVITDITTKEVTTTTTTDETGNTVVTTAECYYPGGMRETMGEERERSAEFESAHNLSSSSYVSSRAAGGMMRGDEQERGESVAEFSIGRATTTRSAAAAHAAAGTSGDRELSEYISEGDESETEEHEIGDTRTRVTHSRSFDPLPGGAAERFRKETVTTTSNITTNQF